MGALLALTAVIFGEFITPHSETMAQRGRAQALQENINQQSDFGLWMRDKQAYVNVGEVLPDLTLLDVRVFEFDSTGKLRSLVHAKNGNYAEEAQRWRLRDIVQTMINRESTSSHTASAAYWSTDVTTDILSVFLIRPDQLSAFQLYQYIGHLRENGQETETYELAFWTKIATPVGNRSHGYSRHPVRVPQREKRWIRGQSVRRHHARSGFLCSRQRIRADRADLRYLTHRRSVPAHLYLRRTGPVLHPTGALMLPGEVATA